MKRYENLTGPNRNKVEDGFLAPRDNKMLAAIGLVLIGLTLGIGSLATHSLIAIPVAIGLVVYAVSMFSKNASEYADISHDYGEHHTWNQ